MLVGAPLFSLRYNLIFVSYSYSGLAVQKKSFSSIGAKIWNSIPMELREKSKNHFKKALHRKLFEIFEKKDDYIDIETIQKEIVKSEN